MKKLRFEVNEEGEIEGEVEGVAGPVCQGMLQEVLKLADLGEVKETKKKEFYQQITKPAHLKTKGN